MSSLLLSLDTEKAFNRLHWGYLLVVLDTFCILGWINSADQALRTVPNARVWTSGFFSKLLQIAPIGQSISSDQLISGVMIGNIEHTIVFYVDNVLLPLTNPITSFPALQDKLYCFSKVWLHKINHSKSKMISICLDSHTKTNISQASPSSWAPTRSLSYLGIQLMSPSSAILWHNYSILLTKLTKLQRLAKVFITFGVVPILLFFTLQPVFFFNFYLNYMCWIRTQ